MRAFGLSKYDIDEDGYVTLFHGGVNLPKKLRKDEIFFMTPSEEEAKDYANMRGGKVFTIKVKPEDVNWNQGSYEVEFDKGGVIKNGIMYPYEKKKKDKINKKEEWIDSERKVVTNYKNVSVGDIMPKSKLKVYEIIYNTKTNNAQFNMGNNRWYDANTVITYEFGDTDAT